MDGYVTIKELAEEIGIDKSNARKYVIDNGFQFEKIRTLETQNQLTLVLTIEQAEQVKQLRLSHGFAINGRAQSAGTSKTTIFYIIQLVPELDCKRVKLGYTGNLNARLRAHRTTCPNAKVLAYYPCLETWELAAIASITREGCELIGNEVYQTSDLDMMIDRADTFFAIMPICIVE